MTDTQSADLVIKMKRCGYNEVHFPSAGEKQGEIDSAKQEEVMLPLFSKEVPASSKKYEVGGNVVVEYTWKENRSPNIKVRKLVYRKDEKLGNLHRIHRRDGCDRLSLVLNGKTYVLRKAISSVAEALYKASGKIKASVEDIVGYIQTLLGNHYVISKIDGEAWSFDREISFGGIRYMELENLEQAHRKKLLELIVEKISELHAGNLVLGGFTLRNIILYHNNIRFTDLRNMRVSRKKSLLVDEFKNIMKYLTSMGFVDNEDLGCAVAYYSSENEHGCREWYSENFKKEVKDELELAEKLEEDI